MKNPKLEDLLVRELKEKLLSIKINPFKGVWNNKRLTGYKNIILEFNDKFGYKPVLQPEIDLILRTQDDKLNAIEVKYLRKNRNAKNFSYYFGIGQALSLMRFGFDHVGLWLLVDDNIPETETNSYGSAAWSLIRNDLNMSLEYTYFKVTKNDDNYSFAVMQYLQNGNGIKLVNNIEDDDFKIEFRYENKIKNNPEPEFMRQLIEKYVCIEETPMINQNIGG